MSKIFDHYTAPVPGTHRYFAEQAEGFTVLRSLRRRIAAAQNAPLYVAGAWDEDYGDYEPVENLAPFEAADRAIAYAKSHPAALRILRARGIDPGTMAYNHWPELLLRLPS